MLYCLASCISPVVIAESLGLNHIGDAILVVGVCAFNKIVEKALQALGRLPRALGP